MKKEILYSIKSPYRESLDVIGYTFGEGEQSCCIVGSTRGNETEQMYVCAQTVKLLKRLEEEGKISAGKSITVVPCVNYYSMNVSKRFWTMDNTDINRMFPGYDLGETTQRIASGLFEKIKNFKFGIQLATFYQDGKFLPHVKIMRTCLDNTRNIADFGLPYGLIRDPRPYDTTTLNYNWQIWDCRAFSLYTSSTGQVNKLATKVAVDAIIRFLAVNDILDCKTPPAYKTLILAEREIMQIHTDEAGIYIPLVNVGDEVVKSQVIAHIMHPLEGHVIEEIKSPESGVIFFSYSKSLVHQNQVVFKVIPF